MKKNSQFWILLLYLLGLFMGALDTGIVTPARSVIQSQLGVTDTLGIWMITIFTLAYAASIPITGKLADRYGSKVMYMVSIFLFGTGSLICALASVTDSFSILLAGRVIQAFGGGGIMPIVTAEIGNSFPPEKRGMALGMVGGVYGIANILGSSAGSAILSIVGNTGWLWLFLINVPISIFIVIAGIFTLENRKNTITKKMDLLGTIVLTSSILSLMYGLTNIKFFDFLNSIQSVQVYPYLLLFVALLPVLVLIEKKAEDPILNLAYFSDKNMVVTYLTGILVGVAMMGIIFVPQFAENALKIKTGTGGYFVTLLGVFAGIGAPLSGKYVDKYGAKVVLMAGFAFNIIGGLFLALVATQYMNIWTVFVSLFFMGLGMGFTMGTPLNYMVLSSVPKNESNTALATLSLVRSIGTIISPAIMVGFIAAAGTQMQTELMDKLPEPPTTLNIPQIEALKSLLEQIKQDPELSKRIDPAMLDIDKQMARSAQSDTAKAVEIPQALIDQFKSADITTINSVTVDFASQMFDLSVTPEVIANVEQGIQKGLDGLTVGVLEMDKAHSALLKEQEGLLKQSEALKKQAADLKSAQMGIQKALDKIPDMPFTAAKRTVLKKQLADLAAAHTGVTSGIAGLNKAIAGMDDGLSSIEARKQLLTQTVTQMTEVRDAVPGAFKSSKATYLETLRLMNSEQQNLFQAGLNKGFSQMYLLVSLLSALGIAVLALYKTPQKTLPVPEVEPA